MARVRKEPAERRQELMDIAMEMFCSQGYTKTMVQDICKKAGVAKGTFFYHFPTKEDVLRAIFEHWSREFLAVYRQKTENCDAVTSLQLFLTLFGMENPVDALMDKLSEEKQNEVMQRLWTRCASEIFDPVLKELFERGIKEGTMHVENHEVCLGFFWAVLDAMYPTDMSEGFVYEHDQVRDDMALRLFETMLGMKTGSLHM